MWENAGLLGQGLNFSCSFTYSISLHLPSSFLPAERAASDGKAVGMAPDILGLHLPGGGRLPAEHGKTGCNDLEEAGDSGGGYWVSVILSPINWGSWWRAEVGKQRNPRVVPE